MANDKTELVDDRPKQESLIKRPERPEKESQIDRGASDEMVDDRNELDDKPDAGEQSSLTGDCAQKTLNGENKGPEWY